ncbi:MAG: SurA N-terminal domain-containing protein [Amphritea sp.]
MLQNIRDNSKGIVAKIVVGLIAVTFALFGVESLVSLTSDSNAPATVNGEEISERDVLQGADLQRRQLLSQMGENADPTLLDDNLIRKAVLDNLIEKEVLVQSATNQGITISDQNLDQMIISTQEFQVDGRFDRQQYEAMLRNAGYSPLMYKELLRKDKLVQQEQAGYMLSAFSLPGETEQVIALDRQTRDMAYLQVSLEDYKQGINLSEADLTDYYDQHKTEYMTEEQVVLEYLLLNKVDLLKGITVDDAELQSQFDQRLAAFRSEERRTVSHIMIEVSDEVDDATALEKAQSLAEQLKGGADFAELAKTESNDPGSAANGGDLGIYEQGLLDGPFEEAVNTLAKGGVSAPVRTQFGYHLIKVTDIVTSEAPTFADLKDELIAEQMDNKVEALYVEKLGQLADLTFSAGDLIEPADELQLEIITTEAFGRSGGNDDLTTNAKVLRVAFSNELITEGVNSDPIELDSGRTLVVRVKEHIRARQQSQEEVAELISTRLIDERAGEALQVDLDTQLVQLKQGAERVAVEGISWTEVEKVGRADREMPFELLQAAFKMPHPGDAGSYSSVTLADGSRALIAVTAVNTPDVAVLDEQERKAMQAVLGQRVGQFDYQAMVQARKAAAEIERL